MPSTKQTDPCQLPTDKCSWRNWHIPLWCNQFTLCEALDSADHMAADQDDIPLIIKLVENPRFDIPGITIFNGAVDLHSHDCIHALLGRGLLPHDEAFTIGFTMGSTNRVSGAEVKLYELAAKYLYPGPYKFDDDDIQVFKDGVHLGYVSDCIPLDKVNYQEILDLTIGEARDQLGIETNLLAAYYQIEKARYPEDPASRRISP